MEDVKVWGISICTSAVIGTVAMMIAPTASKKGVFKLVVSCFVLIGILSPLVKIAGNGFDFEVDTMEYINSGKNQYISENAVDLLEEAVSVSLHSVISDELKKAGYNREFGVKVTLSEQKDGISVDEVNINVGDLHMIEKEKLEDIIGKATGLKICLDVI